MRQLTQPSNVVALRAKEHHPTWSYTASLRSRPLHVCFLIDELAGAGTETQLLALLRHLNRNRVQPYLCLLRGDNPASQALEPDDCPVLRLGVGSLRHPRTLLRAWRFAQFLRRHRIDVLQVYFPDSSYFGVPVGWLAGVRHCVRTRNNLGHWQTAFHRHLGRILNWFTTRTIANCAAAREALLETEGPSPDSVVVLTNGVDLERFATVVPLTVRPVTAERRVGIVANLRPVKGLEVFVRAAALVQATHPRVLFQVAGEGDLRASLERQAAEQGLGGRFLLPGAVADIPGFLGELDVAVLCSHAEGMSNALLEYMAAGRPIVATAVGAAPELIEDGVQGLLVPPGDAGRLASAIGRLLHEPSQARRLGEAARQRALKHHSRAAMVRRFENFYESLAVEGVTYA